MSNQGATRAEKRFKSSSQALVDEIREATHEEKPSEAISLVESNPLDWRRTLYLCRRREASLDISTSTGRKYVAMSLHHAPPV